MSAWRNLPAEGVDLLLVSLPLPWPMVALTARESEVFALGDSAQPSRWLWRCDLSARARVVIAGLASCALGRLVRP